MTTFVLVLRIRGNAEERPPNVKDSTSAEGRTGNPRAPLLFENKLLTIKIYDYDKTRIFRRMLDR